MEILLGWASREGTNPSDVCASGPGEANATVDGAFAYYFATIKPLINP